MSVSFLAGSSPTPLSSDLQMADVHSIPTYPINHPLISIAGTLSPPHPPHDPTFFFNPFSEYIPDDEWEPDQNPPFVAPLPSLNYALALTPQEGGLNPHQEMDEGVFPRELSFSLDLAKENYPMQAAISVAATSSPPHTMCSFWDGRSSELGGSPEKPAMGSTEEHLKAFSPPCPAEESGRKRKHPFYERQEYPKLSVSSRSQSPSLKGGPPEKKRKAAEGKTTDVPSCIACAQQVAPKNPKAQDSNIRGNKNSKRLNQAEESKKKTESGSSGNSRSLRQSHTQAAPPKQDFIHVRARRGEATDSHSLAERVRREKLSERMKLLQSLVPGCSKISGKAVMLDEIINYVQLLQHQVEFLSMKLASVNSSLDVMLPTEMLQGHIIQSPAALDCTFLPNLSFIPSARTKLNQPGCRGAGDLDSKPSTDAQGKAMKRSTATMLNSDIYGTLNSQMSNFCNELQYPYQIGGETHGDFFTAPTSDFAENMRAEGLLRADFKG